MLYGARSFKREGAAGAGTGGCAGGVHASRREAAKAKDAPETDWARQTPPLHVPGDQGPRRRWPGSEGGGAAGWLPGAALATALAARETARSPVGEVQA